MDGELKRGEAADALGVFHMAYLKSVEVFYPGVFVELVRLNYGIDYDEV